MMMAVVMMLMMVTTTMSTVIQIHIHRHQSNYYESLQLRASILSMIERMPNLLVCLTWKHKCAMPHKCVTYATQLHLGHINIHTYLLLMLHLLLTNTNTYPLVWLSWKFICLVMLHTSFVNSTNTRCNYVGYLISSCIYVLCLFARIHMHLCCCISLLSYLMCVLFHFLIPYNEFFSLLFVWYNLHYNYLNTVSRHSKLDSARQNMYQQIDQ